MNSIQYLPVELRQLDLYQQVTTLIDKVYEMCNDSRDKTDVIENKVIDKLIGTYKDVESVNAFYRAFIKPLIGTRTAIDTIFSIVGDLGKVKEWFETSIWQYKFVIEYDTVPELVDIDRIIELCYELKNERSHLIAIRSPTCGYPFRWDYSRWDKDFYDNVEGILINGVYVCFSSLERSYSLLPKMDVRTMYTNNYTSHVTPLSERFRYDEFWYDYITRGSFVKQYTSFNYHQSTRFSAPSMSYINNGTQKHRCGIAVCGRLYDIRPIYFWTGDVDFIDNKVPFHILPKVYTSSQNISTVDQSSKFNIKNDLIHVVNLDSQVNCYIEKYTHEASQTKKKDFSFRVGGLLTRTGLAQCGKVVRTIWNKDDNNQFNKLTSVEKYTGVVSDNGTYLQGLNPEVSTHNEARVEEKSFIKFTNLSYPPQRVEIMPVGGVKGQFLKYLEFGSTSQDSSVCTGLSSVSNFTLDVDSSYSLDVKQESVLNVSPNINENLDVDMSSKSSSNFSTRVIGDRYSYNDMNFVYSKSKGDSMSPAVYQKFTYVNE